MKEWQWQGARGGSTQVSTDLHKGAISHNAWLLGPWWQYPGMLARQLDEVRVTLRLFHCSRIMEKKWCMQTYCRRPMKDCLQAAVLDQLFGQQNEDFLCCTVMCRAR